MRRTSRGYTLLEMIVAVGIFSLVMLTATGAFLTLIRLDREARLTNDVVTNLSFAVDSMARTLRTGTNYDCTPASQGSYDNCLGGGTSVRFTDADGRAIVYALSSGQITVSINGGAATPLTDPRVSIQTLTFYVRGVGTTESAGQKTEPQVTFTIYGQMTTAQGNSVDFTIQGGATQRILELP